MGDDWAAVAAAVNARMSERGMSQKELAEKSGVSVATLRRIQGAVAQQRTPATLAAISRALGWRDAHLREVLRQVPADDDPADSLPDRVSRLESELGELRRQVEELRER